ncbi:uncharacterized protein [Rutidosis leptorrhynchoides]|uniref:uncharacterized protein n=1 Tax=Rutidosis leptorrhynchoides TaxID=125765 RepID=UPI003A99ADAF
MNRLPVRVELDKRGIDMDSIRCHVCNDDIESVEHILLKCPFAKELWKRVFNWWNLESQSYTSLDDMFKGKKLPSNSSKLLQAIEWICGYTIWQNINQVVFQKKKGTAHMALNDIQKVSKPEAIAN